MKLEENTSHSQAKPSQLIDASWKMPMREMASIWKKKCVYIYININSPFNPNKRFHSTQWSRANKIALQTKQNIQFMMIATITADSENCLLFLFVCVFSSISSFVRSIGVWICWFICEFVNFNRPFDGHSASSIWASSAIRLSAHERSHLLLGIFHLFLNSRIH